MDDEVLEDELSAVAGGVEELRARFECLGAGGAAGVAARFECLGAGGAAGVAARFECLGADGALIPSFGATLVRVSERQPSTGISSLVAREISVAKSTVNFDPRPLSAR